MTQCCTYIFCRISNRTHAFPPQAARGLAGMATSEGGAGAGLLPLGASPPQFSAQYSTATGGFKPAPAAPPQQQPGVGGRKKGGAARHQGPVPDLGAFLTAVQLGAAQDGMLVPAAAGPASLATAALANGGSCGSEESEGEEGMLCLPGWGVGDAVSAGASEGEGSEGAPGAAAAGGPAAVAEALRAHFRLARGFRDNERLRREAAVARAQVAMFQR